MSINTINQNDENTLYSSIIMHQSDRNYLLKNVFKVGIHFTIAAIIFAVAITYYEKHQDKEHGSELVDKKIQVTSPSLPKNGNLEKTAISDTSTPTNADASIADTKVHTDPNIRSFDNIEGEAHNKFIDSINNNTDTTKMHDKRAHVAKSNSHIERHYTIAPPLANNPPINYSYQPMQTPVEKTDKSDNHEEPKVAKLTPHRASVTADRNKTANTDCASLLTKLSLGNTLNQQERSTLLHNCK
jgi:hypothetical protein